MLLQLTGITGDSTQMYYKLLQLVPSLKTIIEDQGRSEKLTTNICAKVSFLWMYVHILKLLYPFKQHNSPQAMYLLLLST